MIWARLPRHEWSHDADDGDAGKGCDPHVLRRTQKGHRRSGGQQQERGRDHPFPGELHELVEAEAWKGPANRHRECDHEAGLAKHDRHVREDDGKRSNDGQLEVPCRWSEAAEWVDAEASEKQQREEC